MTIVDFYFILLLTTFIFAGVAVELYLALVRPGAATTGLRGPSIVLFFCALLFAVPYISALSPPEWVMFVYALVVFAVPVMVGVCFAQLCLIEDRRQASRRRPPPNLEERTRP